MLSEAIVHQKIVNQPQIEKRVRIQIPKALHQEPVISRIVSHYGLTVNIAAAVLGATATGDGWFDLRLQGLPNNIQNAIAYFQEVGVKIWPEDIPSDFRSDLEITG